MSISREDYLLAMAAYAEHRGSPAPQSAACVLATRMIDRSVTFMPGTVVAIREGKPAARLEPRPVWREFVTAASSMTRAFARRRYYDKTIRAIDYAR